MKTQMQLYYGAMLETAAKNHDKMAAMQEAAGNHRLAIDARLTAQSRRVAAQREPATPAELKAAHEYGAEWQMNAETFFLCRWPTLSESK
jgi:hypothetical protein